MKIKYYSGHQVIDVISEFANSKDQLLNILNRFGALETDDVEHIRHGEWITVTDGIFADRHYCSACMNYAEVDLYGEEILSKYCLNCGAKMGLGEANDGT